MPNTELVGWAAGTFSLAAFLPYNIAMIRGRARPNRATWWIWTVVGVLMAASYRALGAAETWWLALAYVVGPGITALIALQFGEGGWTRFDRTCIAGAAAGTVLWIVLDAPLAGLVVGIAIDFCGALPTLRKALANPESEDRLTWYLLATGAAANLIALREWRLTLALHPVYMFLIIASIACLVFRAPRRNN